MDDVSAPAIKNLIAAGAELWDKSKDGIEPFLRMIIDERYHVKATVVK